MIQKLEKVLDLAAEALLLYLGRATTPLPLENAAPVPQVDKPKRGRKPKETPAAAPESPFGVETPAAQEGKLSPEDAAEAARHGQEVMGLFIRRYLKAQPTGLERAKEIIKSNLGAPRNGETAWKLEHFTPQDWLKLAPIFEAELEKAA